MRGGPALLHHQTVISVLFPYKSVDYSHLIWSHLGSCHVTRRHPTYSHGAQRHYHGSSCLLLHALAWWSWSNPRLVVSEVAVSTQPTIKPNSCTGGPDWLHTWKVMDQRTDGLTDSPFRGRNCHVTHDTLSIVMQLAEVPSGDPHIP